MARLTRKRRQELEQFWNAYANVPLYIVASLKGRDLLFKACGGVAVGEVTIYPEAKHGD